MLDAPFRVVLDACVLYPMNLRDVLLQAAAEGLYQLCWSTQILDEAARNLVTSAGVPEQSASRLVSLMSAAFPEATIGNFEPLIEAMQNHPKDRHVAAVAVKAGAQVIVTENVRDFVRLPDGIEVQTADEFLSNLVELDAYRMLAAVTKICARRTRPPNEVLPVVLATKCVEFAKALLEFATFEAGIFDTDQFRFWWNAGDPDIVLELRYVNGKSVKVAFPTSTLPDLQRELTNSLARNQLRLAARGQPAAGWDLVALEPPKTTGPQELIEALIVRRVSFIEEGNGSTIVIEFAHGGEHSTLLRVPNHGAQLLLQQTRKHLAHES